MTAAETLPQAVERLALPTPASFSGYPFIRVDGRSWALDHPKRPAHENPRFWAGAYPVPRAGSPAPRRVECPECGTRFDPTLHGAIQ